LIKYYFVIREVTVSTSRNVSWQQACSSQPVPSVCCDATGFDGKLHLLQWRKKSCSPCQYYIVSNPGGMKAGVSRARNSTIPRSVCVGTCKSQGILAGAWTRSFWAFLCAATDWNLTVCHQPKQGIALRQLTTPV